MFMGTATVWDIAADTSLPCNYLPCAWIWNTLYNWGCNMGCISCEHPLPRWQKPQHCMADVPARCSDTKSTMSYRYIIDSVMA